MVRNILKKLAVVFIFLVFAPFIYAETQIAYDDLECGTWNCGSGWAGAWSYTGTCQIETQNALDNYNIRGLSGCDAIRNTDTTGYSSVNVSFYATARSLENNEYCRYYYFDGTTNHEILTLTNGDDDNIHDYYNFDVTQYGLDANAGVRMYGALSTGDYCYIDNVQVIGVTNLDLNIFMDDVYLVGTTADIDMTSSITSTNHTLDLMYTNGTIFCSEIIESPSTAYTTFSTSCAIPNATGDAQAVLYLTGEPENNETFNFTVGELTRDFSKLKIKKVYYSPQVLQGGYTEIFVLLDGNETITDADITLTFNDSTKRTLSMYPTPQENEYSVMVSDTFKIGNVQFNINIKSDLYYDVYSSSYQVVGYNLDFVDAVNQVLRILTQPPNIDVLGTYYEVGDTAKVIVQLSDQGIAVNNATCFASIYYPDNTNLIRNTMMLHIPNSDGLYVYDIEVPDVVGVYPLSVVCDYVTDETSKYVMGAVYNYGTSLGGPTDLWFDDDTYSQLLTEQVGDQEIIDVELIYNNVNTSEGQTDMFLSWQGYTDIVGGVGHFYWWNVNTSDWDESYNKLSSLYTDASFNIPGEFDDYINASGSVRVKINGSVPTTLSTISIFEEDFNDFQQTIPDNNSYNGVYMQDVNEVDFVIEHGLAIADESSLILKGDSSQSNENEGYAIIDINTSGYQNISVSYLRKSIGSELDDYYTVEASYDNGSTWEELESWYGNDVVKNKSFSLSSNYSNNTQVKIRFGYHADFKNDVLYIDNVVVSGKKRVQKNIYTDYVTLQVISAVGVVNEIRGGGEFNVKRALSDLIDTVDDINTVLSTTRTYVHQISSSNINLEDKTTFSVQLMYEEDNAYYKEEGAECYATIWGPSYNGGIGPEVFSEMSMEEVGSSIYSISLNQLQKGLYATEVNCIKDNHAYYGLISFTIQKSLLDELIVPNYDARRVSGTEYILNNDVSIVVQVLQDGVPDNGATCLLDVYQPDENLNYTKVVDQGYMTNIPSSNGMYQYKFNQTDKEGLYVVDAVCSEQGIGSVPIAYVNNVTDTTTNTTSELLNGSSIYLNTTQDVPVVAFMSVEGTTSTSAVANYSLDINGEVSWISRGYSSGGQPGNVFVIGFDEYATTGQQNITAYHSITTGTATTKVNILSFGLEDGDGEIGYCYATKDSDSVTGSTLEDIADLECTIDLKQDANLFIAMSFSGQSASAPREMEYAVSIDGVDQDSGFREFTTAYSWGALSYLTVSNTELEKGVHTIKGRWAISSGQGDGENFKMIVISDRVGTKRFSFKEDNLVSSSVTTDELTDTGLEVNIPLYNDDYVAGFFSLTSSSGSANREGYYGVKIDDVDGEPFARYFANTNAYGSITVVQTSDLLGDGLYSLKAQWASEDTSRTIYGQNMNFIGMGFSTATDFAPVYLGLDFHVTNATKTASVFNAEVLDMLEYINGSVDGVADYLYNNISVRLDDIDAQLANISSQNTDIYAFLEQINTNVTLNYNQLQVLYTFVGGVNASLTAEINENEEHLLLINDTTTLIYEYLLNNQTDQLNEIYDLLGQVNFTVSSINAYVTTEIPIIKDNISTILSNQEDVFVDIANVSAQLDVLYDFLDLLNSSVYDINNSLTNEIDQNEAKIDTLITLNNFIISQVNGTPGRFDDIEAQLNDLQLDINLSIVAELTAIQGNISLVYDEVTKEEISLTVQGTDYEPGDNGRVFVKLTKNNSGYNDALCQLNIYYPDSTGTSPHYLAKDVFMENLGEEGLYYHDFTVPDHIGVYMTSAECFIGINTSFVYAINDSVIEGAVVSGTLNDTYANDEVYYRIDEQNNGGQNRSYLHDFWFDVSSLPEINNFTDRVGVVVINGRINPIDTEGVKTQVYNYNTSTWNDFENIWYSQGTTTDVTITNGPDNLSGYYKDANNITWVRLRDTVQTSDGTQHQIRIDQLFLATTTKTAETAFIQGGNELNVRNRSQYVISNFNSTIDGILAIVNAINVTTTQTSLDVTEISNYLTINITNDLTTIQTNISQALNNQDTILTNIEEVNNTVWQNSVQLDTIESLLDLLNISLYNINGSLTSSLDAVNVNISNDIAGLDTKIDALITLNNFIITQVNGTQERFDALDANISLIQTDLTTIINYVDTLEPGQQDILNNLTYIQNQIDALNFTTDLSGIENTLTNMYITINETNDRLDCTHTPSTICGYLLNLTTLVEAINTSNYDVISYLQQNVTTSLNAISVVVSAINLTTTETSLEVTEIHDYLLINVTNSISNLQDNLSISISNVLSNQDNLFLDLDAINASLIAQDVQLDTIESLLGLLNISLYNINGSLTDSLEVVNINISNDLASIHTKIDTIDGVVDLIYDELNLTIGPAITNIQTNITSIINYVDTLEDGQAQILGNLTQIQNNLTFIQNQISLLNQSQQFNSVLDYLVNLTVSVDALQNEVNCTNSTSSPLCLNIDSLLLSISDLNSTVNDFRQETNVTLNTISTIVTATNLTVNGIYDYLIINVSNDLTNLTNLVYDIRGNQTEMQSQFSLIINNSEIIITQLNLTEDLLYIINDSLYLVNESITSEVVQVQNQLTAMQANITTLIAYAIYINNTANSIFYLTEDINITTHLIYDLLSEVNDILLNVNSTLHELNTTIDLLSMNTTTIQDDLVEIHGDLLNLRYEVDRNTEYYEEMIFLITDSVVASESIFKTERVEDVVYNLNTVEDNMLEVKAVLQEQHKEMIKVVDLKDEQSQGWWYYAGGLGVFGVVGAMLFLRKREPHEEV